MKKALLLFLLMCLMDQLAHAESATGTVASEHKDTVLYHNATVINPAMESEINQGWLLVRGGRIIQVGQRKSGQAPLPDAERRVDLKGKYLLPGLIDVHLHLTAGPHRAVMQDGSPVLSMKGHNQITRYHAISTLATGITTAFSPAGEPEANEEYARHQQTGQWLGPQLIYAGYTFEPTPIIGGSVYPGDEAGWQAEIARQKALGVTHIKLYTGLNKDELAMGNRLAKAAGLKTVAHLDNVSWQYAANIGIDALTHALPTSPDLLIGPAKTAYQVERENPYNQRFIYSWFQHADYDNQPIQTLFNTLAEKQTFVDLTLVVNELLYYAHELDTLYPEEEMWVYHPQFRDKWRANMAAPSYDWTEEDFVLAKQQMPKVTAFLKRLYDAGVPLAIGTDSVASGPFYLRELELSQSAGLNNWQVLQLATNGGARHLGLNEVGQLASGFVADFIVLAGNPLDDLKALKTIETIVQKGQAFQVDELKAKLNVLNDVQL